MLTASSLTREQFVSWLGENFKPSPRQIDSYELKNMVRPGGVCLIWDCDPFRESGPKSSPLIAVSDQQVHDFYSFVSTYVSSYQPFSAFFRVIPLTLLLELLFEKTRAGEDTAEKFVGAIIAETRSQLGVPRRNISDISIQSCLASLSFPAVSGILSGVSKTQFSAILENWAKARMILADEATPVSSNRLSTFWQTVRSSTLPSLAEGISDKQSIIAELISEVRRDEADAEPRTLRILTEGLPKSRKALVRMRGSREERVRAMDEIGSEISSTPIDPEIAELLLGYAASRVAGGSLRYFSLLEQFEQRFPLAPIWFGLFCSMHKESDVLVIGECLGRRILRHSADPRKKLFSQPDADISFEEFVSIMSASRPPKWRSEHQSTISVEVFPAVASSFRANPRPSQREANYSEPSITVDTLQEIRRLATRMLKTLDTVDFPQQGRLFPEGEKTTYLKRSKKSDR